MAKVDAATKERICNYYFNRPGEYISTGTVAKMFGVSDYSVKQYLKAAVAKHGGSLDCAMGRGTMYIPEAEKKEEPDLQETIRVLVKNGFGKNHEGYSDPTATAAIEKVDQEREMKELASKIETSYFDQKYAVDMNPGEVWEADCSNGTTDLMLIIKVYNTHCLRLKLTLDMYGLNTDPIVFSLGSNQIPYDNKVYTFDIRRIAATPNKYIKRKVFELDQDRFDDICSELSEMFMSEDQKAAKNLMEELEQKEDYLCTQADLLDSKKREIEEREKELEEWNEAADRRERNLNNWSTDLLEQSNSLAEKERDLMKKESELKELNVEALNSEQNWDKELELTALRAKIEVYERLVFGMFGKERHANEL